MRKYSLLLVALIICVVGCGAESEPEPAAENEPAPTAKPEIVTVVVTATAVPAASTTVVEETATAENTKTPAAAVQPAAADAAEAAPTAAPEVMAETAEPQAVEEDEAPMAMSLSAQKSETEHSPRPDSFVEPASLDEVVPPPEDSWHSLEPGEMSEFQTYDGVRVREEGEALLDLGDLMRLILKRDTVTQFVPGTLAEENLARISIDFGDTPMLQRIALAMHLSRGGFLGEKSIDSDPIALSTPNAIIIVSGTTFFLAYDPDAEITWVGNFEGTMDVADVELQEGESLPDRQLIAIPAVRGRKYWPIHDHMTPEEFLRLTDLQESSIAVAEMISGPYLIGKYDPEVGVRSGPGSEFPLVGRLAKDEYASIIGRGRGWWQIECPRNMIRRGTDCWVSGGSAYIDTFNTDIISVPVTAQRPTPSPIPAIIQPPETENRGGSKPEDTPEPPEVVTPVPPVRATPTP